MVEGPHQQYLSKSWFRRTNRADLDSEYRRCQTDPMGARARLKMITLMGYPLMVVKMTSRMSRMAEP